jgi:hypothetical protein
LPIFRPDRRHLHHHMLQMGLSRRRVVLTFYLITLIFLLMGFAAYWSRGGLVPALLGVATLVLLICAGKFRFSRSWFAVGRVVGDSLGMRQEVHYALALMRWLELEGSRRASVEELWGDLCFAVQRLGYASLKLKLADGERVWEGQVDRPKTHIFTQALQNGRLGTIELMAYSPDTVEGQEPRPPARNGSPSIADLRVFEIVSDLVAEGWVKAASKLTDGPGAQLHFSSHRPRTEASQQGRVALRFAPPTPAVPSGTKTLDSSIGTAP